VHTQHDLPHALCAPCSVTTKTTARGAQLRNQEYKQLLKGDTRELRRLRRQLTTYETLAKGEWMAKATAGAATMAAPARETVQVGDEGAHTLAVDRETVSRLWKDGRDASWRAAAAQDEAAALSHRLQARAASVLLGLPAFMQLLQLCTTVSHCGCRRSVRCCASCALS
jgi:hypothetical protein